jgi:protein-S-isoprenylcysteine O-methyltransferase Ste14
MLSDVTMPLPGTGWWNATARVVTAMCFVVLGGFAFAAILASIGHGLAGPLAAAGLLANICVFALFLLEACFVMLRLRPVSKRAGAAPRIVALLGTWLMAIVILLPAREASPALLVLGIVLGLAGSALAIASVATLGRSFSIMPEARRLVVSGPYRLMRHPLYVAEEIALCGLVAVHLSPMSVLLLVVQAVCQWCRARNEERVLGTVFADFAEYRRVTPMWFPKALW